MERENKAVSRQRPWGCGFPAIHQMPRINYTVSAGAWMKKKNISVGSGVKPKYSFIHLFWVKNRCNLSETKFLQLVKDDHFDKPLIDMLNLLFSSTLQILLYMSTGHRDNPTVIFLKQSIGNDPSFTNSFFVHKREVRSPKLWKNCFQSSLACRWIAV